MNLPDSSCSEINRVTFCVIQIIPMSNLYINITVFNMTYIGPSMLGDSCIFGGLAAYFDDSKEKLHVSNIACYSVSANSWHQETNDAMLIFPIISLNNSKHGWISLVSLI